MATPSALALLFPGLMQMLSNGAIGGAVASSIARALGAGDRERADNLVWHALTSAAVGNFNPRLVRCSRNGSEGSGFSASYCWLFFLRLSVRSIDG